MRTVRNGWYAYDEHPDESKTRTHRLSKLPDDGEVQVVLAITSFFVFKKKVKSYEIIFVK